ncbi:MAG TPA: AarF/UbiB family protein [Myxococcota bacterium]|nr:AarF/UbiB family protein [Myxococcota bacterium]
MAGRARHALQIAIRMGQLLLASAVALGVFVREAWHLRADGRAGLVRAGGRAHVALCHRLGATFIKVGQIASTRGDLLPRELVEELSTLRDQVPPFPFAAARRVIETSLGRPLEAVFASFDSEPVAAASVAQVHRATLARGGAVVAVKVRRPDIAEKVALDRSILLAAARVAERLAPSLRLVSLREAVATFCDAVEQQIDFRNEARHNRRFRENFREEAELHFPALYEDACSEDVLTMEFVDALDEEQLFLQGVDVQRVVTTGMRCVSRMIFSHGFVHADLHPGNMRFERDGRIVLFDLGLVGELADEDRITNARLLFAFATGDGRTVARLFYESSPRAATEDYARYEREICEFVERLRVQGLGHVELALEIGRIFDILRRHRIQARAHMTMVNLALATAEGLGKRLAPDFSLAQEALPYLAEALGVPAPAPPLFPPACEPA